MRRWLVGLACGLALGAAARVTCGATGYGAPAGARTGERLQEVRVTMTNNTPFELPPEFGHLVGVAERGEVHYLYFEDQNNGAIRMVMIGPRGSVQQARTELQLLTADVYLIKRGRGNEPLPEPAPVAETKPKR